MSKFHKAAWLAAAVLAGQENTAWAQQQPVADEAEAVEEIIVTANKRQESLQDVPAAISAIGGEALEAKSIDDMANLQSYVPGLHVQQQQDSVSISLRGIGLQGSSSITDSGVAFHIDNFYMPRPSGGTATLFDVKRVEVLRGPQGTLYGRNATGGVVNIISNEPQFEYAGQLGATYGSRGLYELRAVLNAKASDHVATRLSLVHSGENGYIKNVARAGTADDAFGSAGDVTARAQLFFDNSDELRILLSGTYSKLNGTGVPYIFLERNLGGPPPVRALVATIPQGSGDPLVIANDANSYNDAETMIGFVRIEKSLGGVDLFLQGGLLRQDTWTRQDLDGSALDISFFEKTQKNDAKSAEFRLSSDGSGQLEWIAGLYYFAEDTSVTRRATARGLTPAGLIRLPDFSLAEFGKSSAVAVFGSATYALADTIRVTGGLRYTKDRKSGDLSYSSNLGQPLPPNLDDVSVSFDKLTWKGGIEWDVAERTLLYVSASTGYKAGGFNLTSNGAPYDPETITAYEMGLKSSPFGPRSRLNIDAFYYAYDDLQLTSLTTINGAPGQFTTNAAKATIYGLEADAQIPLSPAFSISASYAFIDATFDDYFNLDPRDPNPPFNPGDPLGLGRADLSGNSLPYVARHTVGAGFTYSADLGPGRLSASLTTNWHSKKFLREFNHPLIDYVAPNTKTDLSLSYVLRESGVTITAFATNLENDVEKTNIAVSAGFLGASATTNYSKPRTLGVKLDYRF